MAEKPSQEHFAAQLGPVTQQFLLVGYGLEPRYLLQNSTGSSGDSLPAARATFNRSILSCSLWIRSL